MAKLQIDPETVSQVRNWLKERGGVAIWRSVNLSNPGAEWLTPYLNDKGEQIGKPTWQADDKPEIVTNAEDVEVITFKTVKKFRIGLKSRGFKIELTGPSSRKVREACAEAGEGARYIFGGDDGKDCEIQVPDKTVLLTEIPTA